MSNYSKKILKNVFLGLVIFYVSATLAEGAGEVKYFIPDDYAAAETVFLHSQTEKSLDASTTPVLIIGRGNIQGVVADKVTDPLLQGVSEWFFLDPIPEHHCSPQRSDSIVSKWPPTSDLEATFAGKFDRVLFDFGVLNYIGDTRESGTLLRRRYDEIMSIKGDRTKESFEYPYEYAEYILETYPEEGIAIQEKYAPLLQAASDEQRSVLERGIQSAFSCLKRDGHLFVPMEERDSYLDAALDAAKIAEILGISATQIRAESWTSPDGEYTSDNPLLPQILAGDGCRSADIWKWFVVSKLGSAEQEDSQ